MTHETCVCWYCGDLKLEAELERDSHQQGKSVAVLPCPTCNHNPWSDADNIISTLLTDDHLPMKGLLQFGQDIKNYGPYRLSDHSCEKIHAAIDAPLEYRTAIMLSALLEDQGERRRAVMRASIDVYRPAVLVPSRVLPVDRSASVLGMCIGGGLVLAGIVIGGASLQAPRSASFVVGALIIPGALIACGVGLFLARLKVYRDSAPRNGSAP